MPDKKDYNRMTVAQLKAELSANGLELTGKKSELVDRLASFMEAQQEEQGEEEEQEEQQEEEQPQQQEEEEEEQAGETEAAEQAVPEMEEAVEEKEEAKEGEEEEEEEAAAVEEEAAGDKEAEPESEQQQEEEMEEDDTSPDYIMLDEAAGDDEEEDINEEALLDLEETEEKDNIEIEIRTEEDNLGDEESETKEVKEVKVKEQKPKQKTESKENGKKEQTKTEAAEADTKKTRERKNLLEGVEPLSEEEIKKLEEADLEQLRSKKQALNKSLLYRVGKNLVQKFLDQSRHQHSILITPFEMSNLSNEVIQESMQDAWIVNVQCSKRSESGWLELRYEFNSDAKKYMSKLAEELTGSEVRHMDTEFLRTNAAQGSQRLNRTEEFRDKYKECMLISRVELEEESDADYCLTIEDELSPNFPGALTVCVPSGNDKLTNIRFILVEYESADRALEALKEIKEKEITVCGVKVEFDLYNKKWQSENSLLKKEQNERRLQMLQKDQLKGNRKNKPGAMSFRGGRGGGRGGFTPQKIVTIPKGEVLEVETRRVYGSRLSSINKSLSLMPVEEERSEDQKKQYMLLMKEKERVSDDLRLDDYQRTRQGLPHLLWRDATERKKPEPKAKPDPKSPHSLKKSPFPGRGRGAIAGQKRSRMDSSGGSPEFRSPKQSRYSGGSSSFSQDRASYRGSSRGSFRGTSRGGRFDNRVGRGASSSGPRRVHVGNEGGSSGNIRVNIAGRGNSRGGGGGRGMSRGSSRGRSDYVSPHRSSSSSSQGPYYRSRYSDMQQRGDQSSGGYMGGRQSSGGSGGMYRDNNMGSSGSMMGMGQQQQQMSQGMMEGRGQSSGGSTDAGAGANPVQLLLGLSKVLSNQIKQIQGDGSSTSASAAGGSGGSGRSGYGGGGYSDNSRSGNYDNYNRGGSGNYGSGSGYY